MARVSMDLMLTEAKAAAERMGHLTSIVGVKEQQIDGCCRLFDAVTLLLKPGKFPRPVKPLRGENSLHVAFAQRNVCTCASGIP